MDSVSVVEIPRDILDSARLTVPELKVELAMTLYAQGRLSISKARERAATRMSSRWASSRCIDDFHVVQDSFAPNIIFGLLNGCALHQIDFPAQDCP
jgi:hypothetical protein